MQGGELAGNVACYYSKLIHQSTLYNQARGAIHIQQQMDQHRKKTKNKDLQLGMVGSEDQKQSPLAFNGVRLGNIRYEAGTRCLAMLACELHDQKNTPFPP
ncbi:hypothetical protein OUZ56_022703 [Daphnia magna]|uniref:Uncharacterized protein n=1 Tax=Daphnia magna TaxID=35525 RepID=A0ABR0AX77_9CRUS|nr:hypothetical protein OUZ56_022703 [Daphnia magna]